MNIFKTTAAILFIALAISACGGKDKKAESGDAANKNGSVSATNSGATKLEGAWEVKREEGYIADMNVGTVYEFKGNKLTIISQDGVTNPGTTIVTHSTFSFQADGSVSGFIHKYHFNGDTLVVEIQHSDGQIFHMVKK